MLKKLIVLAGAGVAALASSKSGREKIMRRAQELRGHAPSGKGQSARPSGGTVSTAPGATLSSASEDHGDSDPMGSTASDSKGPTRP